MFIASWLKVDSAKETRISLELVRVYWKFLPNLGILAKPLNALTILLKWEFRAYTTILVN
jgi:hypothetical protein